MSSIHPSIHRRECGSYPCSLRFMAVATPTRRQFITWPHGKTNTCSHTYTNFVLSLSYVHMPALLTTHQLSHSWGHFSFFIEFSTRTPESYCGSGASPHQLQRAQSALPISRGIQPLLLAHPSVCMGKDKDIQYIPENLNVWVAEGARQRRTERTMGDIQKKKRVWGKLV